LTAPAPKTNVVPATTSFVGRDGDLSVLREHLRRGRLVTVLGPPGSGKTRLAREYALRYGGAYLGAGAGGVWFADLSHARSHDDFLRVVAQALDVSLTEERTQRDASRRLSVVLASRGPLLLILDNFEQLLPEAREDVERWLGRAPELSIVVTSRVRLGVNGEAGVEIHGLGLPKAGVQDADAFRLFLDRARAARSDFAPSELETTLIADILARLDGLPLAIELAGARMGVLGPKQLLERLSHSLDLLRGRDGSTLRATLDWSWNLLSEDERDALGQASVFQGGFSLEAAEDVIRPTRAEAPDVLTLCERLRNNSLLRSHGVPELPGEVRFSMLEMIRAYAEEKLEASGGAALARERHAEHFVRVGSDWASRVEREPESLRRLALEAPNLVAVHRRLLSFEQPGPERMNQALRANLALEPVFYMRGPTAPCLAMLDDVFAHDLVHVRPDLVALGLKARGRALRDLGRHAESRHVLERALALAREIGDRSIVGRVLGHVGYLAQVNGRLTEALAAFREGLAEAEAAGDRRTQGMSLASVATALASLGQLDEAAEVYDQALAIDDEVGNRYAAAAALASRAELYRARGRPEAARADLERALTVYREFGERRHEGLALLDLGVILAEEGEFAEARARLELALERYREFGSRPFQARVLLALGDLEREQGRLLEARRNYEQAQRIGRELSDASVGVWASASLGAILAIHGRSTQAREALAEAQALARESTDSHLERLVELMRGHLDLAEGIEASAQGKRDLAEERLARARERLAVVSENPNAAERLARRVLGQAVAQGLAPHVHEPTPSGSERLSSVGRYELLLEIAAGGMATVYAGRQRGAGGFERVVAVKRMHPHLSALDEFASAFMDEARIASLIRHQNVVGVHDVHEARGEHLLVMDYVDGVSLASLMASAWKGGKAIPRATAVYIVAQALRGLHAAHELTDIDGTPLSIVHRDASPHNVLLGADGSVRITDFGIAKIREQNAHTNQGHAKGKFRYMAPEQARGGDIDRRADVFALGVVSWELLTGRRLFESGNEQAVLATLEAGNFRRPSVVDASIPEALESIVMKALNADREGRYATALAFARALEDWSSEVNERAREPDVARLVEELSGQPLAQRRRSLSEALQSSRGIDAFLSMPPTPTSVEQSPPTLRDREQRLKVNIGASGRWFMLSNGERVSLERRRALRLILKALVDRRSVFPILALSQAQLLEIGWPGEKVRHDAGTLRVYNALSTLRKLGLRDVLLSRDDGYLLDPKVDVVKVDEE
jgi:serine/threonine protein kinase/predicted ATPase